MKSTKNFILLEREEFRDWLKEQKISRKITTLQVHHTWKPNYSTRKNQDHFKCLEGMRDSHMNSNGWKDIGQNITIFEDGRIGISLGRSINVTPAGIKGANTGAICIENIGNFDKNGDVMSSEQKKAILHVYAALAEKLSIPIDTEHIVYHHWFSADGTKIVDFKTGDKISTLPPAKTCPGLNFWGDGNTVQSANKNFIPQIKEELEKLITKKGEDKLEITNNQRTMLVAALKALHDKNVITDSSWIEKAANGTLTLSELTWLNTIIMTRK